MSELTLTADQDNAFQRVCQLITDPTQRILVIEGHAGTGKTTLVKHIIEHLPKLFKTCKLLDPDYEIPSVYLTATTNKAAEALQEISGEPVRTIHSFLGLRIHTDYSTMETRLVKSKNMENIDNSIVIIDEASFVDHNLLKHIFQGAAKSKLLFMGDPTQLVNHKSVGTPVFDRDYPKAKLSKVMRQSQDNPVLELATAFRGTVETGEFFSFTPDGHHVQHLPREQFEQAICQEFLRPDWKHNDSKVLAWTNKAVTKYNTVLRELATGTPEFKVGDYAICNSYISGSGKQGIRTDETVHITKIEPYTEYGVEGWTVQLEYRRDEFFLPKHFSDKKRRIKQAQDEGETYLLPLIDQYWIDLRAAYSCTVNKSQGSTYDKVFIDLDDISRCNNGNQIARMLYVAVSRARHQVIFTGDLV